MAEPGGGEEGRNIGLRNVMGLNSEFLINEPKVEGEDHLKEILPDERVIVVGTHLSDADIPEATRWWLKSRKAVVTGLSSNLKDPFVKTLLKFTGAVKSYVGFQTKERSYNESPVTYFNPDDFLQVERKFKEGNDIIISAHRPFVPGENKKWELPDRPSIGPVFIAQLTGARIVPVALDLHSTEPIGFAGEGAKNIKRLFSGNKPEATFRIGAPLTLERIPKKDLELVEKLLGGNRNELIASGEYEAAKIALNKLKDQTAQVMRKIAELLPPEKKGIWGTSP